MPRIKFTRSGWSAAFGAFSPGDTLTCGEAEARHFVQDAAAAEYVEAPVVPAVEAPAAPAEPVVKRKRAKE
jgi:hypothetical protein